MARFAQPELRSSALNNPYKPAPPVRALATPSDSISIRQFLNLLSQDGAINRAPPQHSGRWTS